MVIGMLGILAIMVIVVCKLSAGYTESEGVFVLNFYQGSWELKKVKVPLKGDIIIPSRVKVIGPSVFADMKDITSVKFPNTLYHITAWAFKNCAGLKTLYAGESTEVINNGAFFGCTELEEIRFGCRIRFIKDQCFANCPNIKRIVIENYQIPEAFNSSFDDNIKDTCTVYVQQGCKEQLTRIPGWGYFKNVQEITEEMKDSFRNADHVQVIETMPEYVSKEGDYYLYEKDGKKYYFLDAQRCTDSYLHFIRTGKPLRDGLVSERKIK